MNGASTKKRVPNVNPVKRTRPRGLSVLHQEQIEDSRQRILSAAEAAFRRNSYGATPVDTIITIAGVSRATFYKYFTNKFDLAKGLIGIFTPKLFAVFDTLPDRPTLLQSRRWLRKLLKLYEENRQFTALLGEVSAGEPEFFPEMIAINSRLLDRLAARIPAFGKAMSGRPEHAHIHVVAHLRIQHVFAFCNIVTSKRWDVDIEAGIASLADDLNRFVIENG